MQRSGALELLKEIAATSGRKKAKGIIAARKWAPPEWQGGWYTLQVGI
jgi:hypothetical protein